MNQVILGTFIFDCFAVNNKKINFYIKNLKTKTFSTPGQDLPTEQQQKMSNAFVSSLLLSLTNFKAVPVQGWGTELCFFTVK